MTVIVGLNGYPGLILCADSQETVQGYSKKSVYKLEEWDHKPFRFSIGAAGVGHYCDMLSTQISNTLLNIPTFDLQLIGTAIQETLLDFYPKHIWSRPQGDRADVETLIAIQPLPDGHCEMFQTCETALKYIKDSFASIGIGCHLADYIAARLYSSSGGLRHQVATAVYVLSEVIENIDGCGKEPLILFFGQDGTHRQIYPDEIARFAEGFRQYDDTEKEVFQFVTDVGESSRLFWGLDHVVKSITDAREMCESWAEFVEDRDARFHAWVKRSRQDRKMATANPSALNNSDT
ncbi:MAG: hypothetical protein ABR991_00040 [Terracidiphilus sp.]|jgi:hypothetical protein